MYTPHGEVGEGHVIGSGRRVGRGYSGNGGCAPFFSSVLEDRSGAWGKVRNSIMSRSHNGVDQTSLGERLAPIRAVRAVPPLPLSVVIPTLNEARNIGHVLALMPAVEELIIVDGCSDDGTVQAVRRHRPDARIILQKPEGKGTAM